MRKNKYLKRIFFLPIRANAASFSLGIQMQFVALVVDGPQDCC